MRSSDPIEPSVERTAIEPEQVRFPRFIPAAQREHALGVAPIELVEGKHLVERDPHDVSVEELQFNCQDFLHIFAMLDPRRSGHGQWTDRILLVICSGVGACR